MALAQTWIDATRRQLTGGFSELRCKLANDYNPGDGKLTLSQDVSSINTGTILSAGLNVFYVWSIAGNIATVEPAQDGAVDVIVPANSIVRINPRFTDWAIWQELANDLADLSGAGLYGVNTSDLTYNPIYTGYDLGTVAASNLIDIYEVKYLTPGPARDMRRLPESAWRLTRNAVTKDIPSGMSIQILNPSINNVAGYTVRVVWQSLLIAPSTPATDLSTVGLLPSAYDLPPLGAAINLMAGREIPRNSTQTQGDVRRALEVPAGAILASANGLKMQRQKRISTEVGRLLSMYPLTMD